MIQARIDAQVANACAAIDALYEETMATEQAILGQAQYHELQAANYKLAHLLYVEPGDQDEGEGDLPHQSPSTATSEDQPAPEPES